MTPVGIKSLYENAKSSKNFFEPYAEVEKLQKTFLGLLPKWKSFKKLFWTFCQSGKPSKNLFEPSAKVEKLQKTFLRFLRNGCLAVKNIEIVLAQLLAAI